MNATETTLKADLLELCELADLAVEMWHHERCCGGDPRECISGPGNWREKAALIDRVKDRIESEVPCEEPAR